MCTNYFLMYNIHIQLDLKLAIPCCGDKLENTAIQQKAKQEERDAALPR